MQTPLQASGMGQGGFANAPYVNNIVFDYMNIPITFNGFGGLSTQDNKQFKSASGVFDSTCFKPPDQSQFPRIY